ncbi:MAG: GGDEF domain-containing protein [Acidimicrobiia bacterium]|nr:GGDEF domain-containing protein [Acidimicrobiia bacterium]
MAVLALSQRLLGRVAAFMFVAAGLADLATRGFPTPEGVDTTTMVVVDLSIIVGGACLFALPWHRWSRRALLVFVPIALGSVVWRNWALGPDNATYSMYFVVAAAWVGVTFRPGTSLMCSPMVALAYLVPLLVHHEPLGPSVGYLAVTVSVYVVMGEALAWLATRLRSAEQADGRRLQDMRRLVTVSEALAHGLDGRDAGKVVAGHGASLMRAHDAEISFVSDSAGDDDPHSPLVERCLSEGRIAWAENGTSMAAPLSGTSGVVGAIELRGLRVTNREYAADLAGAFATQAALAFERLWVTESLIDASLQDELTGLGNRRGASAALSRLAPGDAVVMLDLDNFKSVNDEFGHAVGDDVLRRLGAFLRDAVREGDSCARYGGEEFVLVLRRAGTRARVSVDRFRSDWNAGVPITTFSCGIALHVHGQPPGTTLRFADEALYDAKRAGRDCVKESSASVAATV